MFPVTNNSSSHIRLGFELLQIIRYDRIEESGAVLKSGLVNDYRNPLSFNPLHNALDGGSTEVVAVALHSQTVNANDFRVALDDLISNEVFADGIGFDNRFD